MHTASNAIQATGPQATLDELSMLVAARIRRNQDIDPRAGRNAAKYKSIRESIAQHGVNQPILVRPITGDPDYDYEVVAGNTRHACTLEIGIELIPAMIRQMTDAEARVAAAIENMQRADLTPIEEAKHAKVVLGDMGNDHDEVCRALGWSRTKLNSRILLSHCNNQVAEALVQDQIKIGHAELLAGVAVDAQSVVLARIIELKMTVVEARDRLFSFARDLTKAKFDTSGCVGCPKNSATSSDLFDTKLDGSMCQDGVCWDAKAQALIAVKLIDAKTEFGVVHTDLSVPRDACVQLQSSGAEGVGDQQYSACTGCASFGAVILTTVGNEGVVKGGFCFNKPCNETKRKDYKAALAALSAPVATLNNGAGGSAAGAGIADKTSHAAKPDKAGGAGAVEKKPQASVMRKGMRRQAFNTYAQMGQQAVKSSPNLALAIAITSLYFDCRSDLPNELSQQIQKQLGIQSHLVREKRAELEVSLASRTVEELTDLMTRLAACTVYRSDSQDQFEQSVAGSQSIAFIEFCGLQPQNFFLMTADYLKSLVKAGVVIECQRSGFAAKYNEVKGDKAFALLAAMKSDDMIKAIMAFTEFDWTGYLPEAVEIAAQKSSGTKDAA